MNEAAPLLPLKQLQQHIHLLIERHQILLHNQMQRRRPARTMTERQNFQHPAGEQRPDALLRQPAVAHLVLHSFNGGVDGGKGPGFSPFIRLLAVFPVGNADEWLGGKIFIAHSRLCAERMVPVRNGDKVDIHQPLATPGHVLPPGQHHDIGLRMGGAF